jgi:hypothetical protein
MRLKKGVKILWVSLAVIVVLLLGLWLARNVILTTVFQRIVTAETDGKVHLEIESLDFSFFHQSISVDSLSIKFDSVYIDREKHTSFDRIRFSGVSLEKFNIISLITDKALVAKRLVFSHPDVIFITDGVKKKKVRDPKELLLFIEHSSGNNFGFLAHIGSIELQYGQVEIIDKKNPEIKFSTESLTIFLDDFNTIEDKKWERGRMFFSKSLYLKIIQFYKSFDPGYALAIDSLTWFSGKYNLEAYGMKLLPKASFPDTLPKLDIRAESILINDFHLKNEDSINKATVQKLILNNGLVQLRMARGFDKSKKKGKLNNKEIFQLIVADTLILNRNQLFIETYTGDTMLSFKNLDLTLEGVKLDSSYMNDPENHFRYSYLRFNTESFFSEKLIPGARLESRNVSYNSKREKFVLDEFRIVDDKGDFVFHSGRIKLNVSVKKLLRNKPQRVDAFVIRPYAEVNLMRLNERNKSNNNEGIDLKLEPGNINFVHGTIKAILANGADRVEVNDVSLLLNSFKYNKEEHILRWDNLSLKLASLFYGKQDQFEVVTGACSFDGQNLLVNKMAFTGQRGGLQSVLLKKITLQSLDLASLTFNHELKADRLLLSKPEIKLEIESKVKGEGDTLFSIAKIVADIEKVREFTVDLKNLSISNGMADVKFIKPDGLSGIHSNYSLNWNGVRFGYLYDAPLSNLKGFTMNLWDTYHYGNGLRTNVGKLIISSDNGYLGIENVEIVHYDSTLKRKWEIKDLSVKNVGVRGFDYQGLLGKDRVLFNKLMVDGFTVDVVRHGKNEPGSDESGSKPFTFNLQKELPFETMFDSVEIQNLRLNYLQSDSLSTTQYGIGDFKLVFAPELKKNKKSLSAAILLNESAVEFDSLLVLNEKSGLKLTLNRGNLKPDERNLLVTGLDVTSGNSNREQQQSHIAIDTLLLEGISVSDSLPITFSLRKLGFANTEISIVHKKTKLEKQSADSTLKMAGLYRFSKMLRAMIIDTILFSDIDLNYLSADSSKKHLSVDDVKLLVRGTKLIPSIALDTLPVQFSNLFVEIRNRSFVTNDSLYEMKAQRLSYNYADQTFSIDSFYMIPLLDTIPFFNRHKWQTQRVNLFVPEVRLAGFDLNGWNRNGILHFNEILVNDMVAHLHRDKTYPRDSLIRPLLQGMLHKIKQPFTIDSLKVRNAYLYYSQKDVKSDKPGYIYLTDFNITGVNFTNLEKKSGSMAKLFVDLRLMGQGRLDGSFYFPLMESQGSQFWFTLKTEKLDLTAFNPMVENLAGLTILKGKGSIDIPLVTANDTISMGSMLFKYRGLKISLYNRKKAKQLRGISSPLVNFVLNDLVLRSNNPNWFRRPRVGIVYFYRNRNKSIVNFVWKSTFSGIISTLGFNTKEQRKRRKEYRKQEFDVQRQAVKEEKYGK